MQARHLAVAVFVAFLATCGNASAKPVYTTKYVYYSIGGNNAVDIYRAMLSRGPRVNGAKAYAATSAVSSQDGKLLQGKNCQIEDYRLKIEFEIKLPKIKNEKALAAEDRGRWKQFVQFLKRHEETHRAIWLDCANQLENKVARIKASSCAEADSKASKLWEQTRKACSKRHDAFDAAEQKKLMTNPFVRVVYRRSQQSKAAKAQ